MDIDDWLMTIMMVLGVLALAVALAVLVLLLAGMLDFGPMAAWWTTGMSDG